jgi:hypothetical protein
MVVSYYSYKAHILGIEGGGCGVSTISWQSVLLVEETTNLPQVLLLGNSN